MSDDDVPQLMPEVLSDRMRRLPPYMFGRINKLKNEMRQADRDVIDLGMGNPKDATPTNIVEKLCEAVRDPRNHRYSDAAGLRNLRREVAKVYSRHWQVDLEPDTEIIATIGSKEGFSHLCLALLGQGDVVRSGWSCWTPSSRITTTMAGSPSVMSHASSPSMSKSARPPD